MRNLPARLLLVPTGPLNVGPSPFPISFSGIEFSRDAMERFNRNKELWGDLFIFKKLTPR
ncbi:hypothetical protein DSO57_1024720 [Entomophthora muscae]|uniref:Uncharacterized protein n=1 Tax=Entomophthora muscae TaxID=34485 RepID=A0ACC2SRK2_9FUNG|nr:hypothetical protein DSO57_1024720 [Entomophthora muscae]